MPRFQAFGTPERFLPNEWSSKVDFVSPALIVVWMLAFFGCTTPHKVTYTEWVNAVRSPERIAEDLGIDKADFQQCQGSPRPTEVVSCVKILDRVSKELERDIAKRAARYGSEPPSSNDSGVPAAIPTAPSDQSVQQARTASSPWRVSSSTNALTGEVNITAINGYGDQSIVVRLRGSKLDCYVTTGKFLETADNMDSRRSLVKYRFDDGPIVRQSWTISDDNTALFFPGNATTFLRQMHSAKRFVIEYSPADVIPETASFDVTSFPSEFSALGVGHSRP
jgi:hypothetical protein